VSPSHRTTLLLVALLPLAVACSARKHQAGEAVPPPTWLSNLPVAPLEILEYRATEAEGEHALFMRLSRFPDRLTYGEVEQPPEIVLQMDGPSVGEDLPEERVVIPDALIPAVRVSRKAGTLTVVLEIAAPELQPYRVLEAADWVTVRVRPGR
jgi:hypothetical protein